MNDSRDVSACDDDKKVSLLINKMLSEVRTKLERLRAQEAALCELQRRSQ